MTNSLSVNTSIYKNQVSNVQLITNPNRGYKDKLSSENQSIPPVDYAGDIFEKQSENNSEKELFTASDGKKYNLKEVIKYRLEDLHCVKEKKTNNIFGDFTNWIKETFNIGNTYKKYETSIYKSYEILDKIKNTPQLFFYLTGFKYNNDNMEKFLIGKIKLKSEIMAEKYLGQEIKISSTPYISEYYISNNTLSELKNSRKELNKKEIKQYNTIKNLLPEEYQQKLSNILTNGQLLQDNSEGNITILTSLYKMATEDRAEKINNIQLIKNCIEILDNPYVITQNAEDIPEEYQNEFSEKMVRSEIDRQEKLIAQNKALPNANMFQSKPIDRAEVKNRVIDERKEEIFKFRSVGTCAAASIEFELATRYPAEFFRIIEGLSSKKKKVSKNVKIGDFNKSQLELFKTKHEIINDEQANVTITADENAYLLAEIQNKYKDENERSIIDILMQSAIMNLGSRQTYNSIDDTRETNEFTNDNCGLTSIEAAFAREIITGQITYNKNYKNVDNNGIVSDLYKPENVKNEILRALQKNNSVVAGCIFTDEFNRCVFGHEITIIGYTKNIQGHGFFIFKDSDHDESRPVIWPEELLLKRIHHAII